MFVNVGDDASVFNETHHVLKFSALASKVNCMIQVSVISTWNLYYSAL